MGSDGASLKTPALGKFRNSPSPTSKDNKIDIRDEQIADEDIDESDAYRDDDFDSSENSAAALAKATITASGKLPPLSGSYPYGADEKSLSQSF